MNHALRKGVIHTIALISCFYAIARGEDKRSAEEKQHAQAAIAYTRDEFPKKLRLGSRIALEMIEVKKTEPVPGWNQWRSQAIVTFVFLDQSGKKSTRGIHVITEEKDGEIKGSDLTIIGSGL